MQVPPRSFSSISATDHPRSARRCARGLPPWPEPMMIASYFMEILRQESLQNNTSDATALHADQENHSPLRTIGGILMATVTASTLPQSSWRMRHKCEN